MSKKRLFAATNQPSQLVNQKEILQTVKDAIYRDDDSCQIVVLRGEGGLGKTRLLEEILRRLNHPKTVTELGPPPKGENWAEEYPNKTLPSDLLDFMDVKMHARNNFIETIGNPQNWSNKISFPKFELAQKEQNRLEQVGASQSLVDYVAKQTEMALWQDYKTASSKHRLLIPLDTTEQLSLEESSRLFIEWEILQPEDILYSTQQWLLTKIAAGEFRNTTLLIAGRGIEGAVFFEELELVAQKTENCSITWCDIKPFAYQQIKEYFEALLEDWQEVDGSAAEDMRQVLEDLLADEDQLKLLELYTEGKPIYLSFYTEILVESRRIPEPLQKRFEEALGFTAEALKKAREEIQAEFIRMLFYMPGLRSQIMQLLARATWGVTAEQIHFVLDSKLGDRVTTWQPQKARLAEIEAELEDIMRFSLVKKKPGRRIGLQDEVYDIFAQYMLRSEETRQAEIKERQKVYSRLRDWAKYHYDEARHQKAALIQEDINRIRISDAEDALNAKLIVPMPRVQKVRDQLSQEMMDFSLEAEQYNLLTNPRDYIDLFILAQIESRILNMVSTKSSLLSISIWRLLKDRYAFNFVDLDDTESLGSEKFIEAYKRTLQQDEASAWILRFFTQKQFGRATSFANKVDAIVKKLIVDDAIHPSWMSSFVRSQRLSWKTIAEIYEADDIDVAVEQVEKVIDELKKLANTPPDQIVFTAMSEPGYQGTNAAKRLHVIIANGYNVIGYGKSTTGNFRDAIQAYGEALKNLRQLPTEEQLHALQATVLNNLSRALVELGKRRAIRICQDGLTIRLEEGDLSPIALSYNTLGLIYNDLLEPRKAMEACGKANAIARTLDNSRLQGLVSIQLAESFRRQARRTDLVQGELEQEELYRQAETACEIAFAAFATEEPVRKIEAEIEFGCLYRDWSNNTDKDDDNLTWQERKDKAISDSEENAGHLINALKLAREHEIGRLELDALVNIAWTHYYAGDFEQADAVLDEVGDLTPPALEFKERQEPPLPGKVPEYYLKLLSKALGLRGRMMLDVYKAKVVEFREKYLHLTPEERQKKEFTWQDRVIDKKLQQAATAYVKGIAYSQLMSPRSQTLSLIYDFIYHRVQKMNPQELDRFSYHVNKAQDLYRINELKLENLGNVSNFLEECFGEYPGLEFPDEDQGE